MKNAIKIYLNYVQNRLTEYGVFLLKEDTPFIRDVFSYYFETYCDNYYYHIFHTVDTDYYNKEILKLELDGIMEEMLDDYKSLELEVSNEEYSHHQKRIRECKDLSYEIINIEELKFSSKDELPSVLENYIHHNSLINNYIENKSQKLIKLVMETYQKRKKILNYETHFFQLTEKRFANQDNLLQMSIIPSIKALDVYNKNLVKKVLEEKKLDQDKLVFLIQKLSLEVLREYENHFEVTKRLILLPDTIIYRGKIIPEIKEILDNSLLARYVILGISYEVYKDHANQFESDYEFACIMKYNNGYSEMIKTINDISRELFFQYVIIQDCVYDKRNQFLEYHNDNIKILLYEEV